MIFVIVFFPAFRQQRRRGSNNSEFARPPQHTSPKLNKVNHISPFVQSPSDPVRSAIVHQNQQQNNACSHDQESNLQNSSHTTERQLTSPVITEDFSTDDDRHLRSPLLNEQQSANSHRGQSLESASREIRRIPSYQDAHLTTLQDNASESSRSASPFMNFASAVTSLVDQVNLMVERERSQRFLGNLIVNVNVLMSEF